MSISEVKETVKTNVKELGRQVADGATESMKAAYEKKQLLDMEREIRLGRISAELNHAEEIKGLKKTVCQETKDTKNALEEMHGI